MNAPAPILLDATCSCGHRWQVSSTSLQDAIKSTSCPTCGSIATVIPTNTDDPLCAVPEQPEIPGFEILGELGRGGMGVVYQARQHSPERTVALKLVQHGLGTSEEILSRFRGEAEAIAKLEHPNIVRIYAVGDTGQQMYLVLEYVPGGSLSERLRKERPAPREAAETLETLADAVHFAHQRSIIHRDLKPANVLLTKNGTPKITDFGLAKQLDSELEETKTGEILGTVLYMAPEQATGVTKNIGPACDVHALGVILYEMLTGRRPFDGGDVMESLTLLTTTNAISPRRLMPSVPRDLELICLKCLQKLPSQRYESASALAQDLRRFLDGKPILAKPQSTLDRVQKWVRRRPALAALLAGIVLVPVLTALGLYWHGRELGQQLELTEQQRARAEANLSSTQASVDELLTEINTGVFATYPASSGLRAEMLNWALTLCKDLRVENPDNPHLRLQAARAARQMADIQRMLGEENPALASYHQASTELAQLLKEGPDNKDYLREFATLLNNRSLLHQTTNQLQAASADLRAAYEIWQKLVEKFPQEFDFELRRSGTLNNMGLLSQRLGDPLSARKWFREALSLSTPPNLNDDLIHQQSILLASALTNLGRLLQHEGQSAAASKAFSAALNALQGNDHDLLSTEMRVALATIHNNLATVSLAQENTKSARDEFSKTIALLDELCTEFPSQPNFREQRAAAQLVLIPLLSPNSEQQEIESLLSAAKSSYEMLAQQFPQKAEYRQGVAQALEQQARFLFALGDQSEADQALLESLALQQELVEQFAQLATVHSQLGRLEQTAGELLVDREDWEDAAQHFENAILAQQQALELEPGQRTYLASLRNHFQSLASSRLSEGNIAAAAQVAERMAKRFSDQTEDLYRAAEILTTCYPLAVALKGDQRIHDQPVDKYCEQLLQSEQFSSIKNSAQFQTLLKKLKKM